MGKIYIGYHKDAPLIENDIVKPILLGAEANSFSGNIIKDNSGEHISNLNPKFCELTGLYWMWKNDVNEDFTGLFHYRRHLILNDYENKLHANKWGLVPVKYEDGLLNQIGVTQDNIKKLLNEYDAILPEPWNVKNMDVDTLYSQYQNSPHHHIEDLDVCFNIVKELYPEWEEKIQKVIHQELGLFTNIFVMKKNIFYKYCEWLFPVLFELERRIDETNYDVQEVRYIGYIAERLFSIYFLNLIDEKKIKHKYVKRSFLVE